MKRGAAGISLPAAPESYPLFASDFDADRAARLLDDDARLSNAGELATLIEVEACLVEVQPSLVGFIERRESDWQSQRAGRGIGNVGFERGVKLLRASATLPFKTE